jgi:predicted amidohydrolase YtcJ
MTSLMTAPPLPNSAPPPTSVRPMSSARHLLGGLLAAAALPLWAAVPPVPADLVVTGARVYTVDAARPFAQAFAVKDGRFVFVGAAAEARAWIGPRTRILRLGGKLVLPGLIDSHIHPLDIVDFDTCDLRSKPRKTLRALSAFVHQCIVKYRVQPGQWLKVFQWNYTDGNEPDAQFPTLRAALDRASRTSPIEVFGNDGHHGAYNSAALAMAKNAAGETVGLSKETIPKYFPNFAQLIAVDAAGEPNGAVNEDARFTMERSSVVYANLDAVSKVPERITQRLNAAGITGVLDAMTAPEGLAVYDALLARGRLTVRANLALFFDPEDFRSAAGQVDYDAMVARAQAIRARYASNPLLRADTVKLFADGVLEGNPYAVPPTLPDSPSIRPYLQPIFGVDAHGRPTVKGYVDTASELCRDVRGAPEKYREPAEVAQFQRTHGFHPGQCTIASGQLQHDRQTMLEFARRFHLAGFNLHIHAIGDAAVRTAVDAIESARDADGNRATRDGIAHLQLGDPADVARIGRDHLYIAYTYSWADVDPGYDMTVIPFIQTVSGNGYRAVHPPGSYYESNAYPVRSSKAAGAVLVAGSDAPVETSDPRPFVNMSRAVTRALPGLPALNAGQAISIREVIEAYTINGARFLGRDADAGSIEVGKAADFIVVDRDILKLADAGRAQRILDSRVLETWFGGKPVYLRDGRSFDP